RAVVGHLPGHGPRAQRPVLLPRRREADARLLATVAETDDRMMTQDWLPGRRQITDTTYDESVMSDFRLLIDGRRVERVGTGDQSGDRAALARSGSPPGGSVFSPRPARDKENRMRTRQYFEAAGLSVVPRHRHAVVVGGSLAGMLAARVLSDHFDSVTLLERDRFPEAPAARKGLPQGRHAHALLERGRGVLERLLPGLTGELVRAGAEPLDFTQDVAWMTASGWYVRFPGDLRLLASSRDLSDWGAGGRVAALPNVRIGQEEAVAGRVRGWREGAGVAGVRLRSRAEADEVAPGEAALAADLVVVAEGRHSRLPEWLTALGYEP